MANRYDVGDLVRCQGAFTDSDGNLHDPENVFFEFRDPSSNLTSYQYVTHTQVVKSATGTYYVDVDADEEGQWWYRWWSTGSGQAAGEQSFSVNTHF